jgi:hypothetical protein
MPSPRLDPQIQAHLEWIGFVRPIGLVVSAPALVRAGAILDRRDAEGQRLLQSCTLVKPFDPKEGPVPYLPNFKAFAESVLGWTFSPKGYAGVAETPIPPELEVPLPDYGETLRPDFAVRELEPREGAGPWQLLVRVLEPGTDFDSVVREAGALEASAHGRMERLLRQTRVTAGLLFNGRALRLLSAPRGESSGWLDFRVEDMVQTAGRSISTAMRLLLNQARLLSLPHSQRLAALLKESRKFQNEVSERLAEQVLHALYELLRGFQAAHDASKGNLLREPLVGNPDAVYRALLTVILRLVFLLYAEERDMLPEDETFLRFYSLAGLYERLREDSALFPDTMDQRYGAWSQLLVLFRMIHGGADALTMRLPRRHGVLFNPDRFPFLEGRASYSTGSGHERIEAPLVPDGTIYRALEKLLVLDGERISYRALDVEQIGSVYETMMGFRLETATGRSVAIKSGKKQGAPTALDLDALLGETGSNRPKTIQDRADRTLTDRLKKSVSEATSLEDLHAALLPVIDQAATPDLVPRGAIVLQPSEARRRSGSHYTPRELTEPIVRTTLDPILARLRGDDGKPPGPDAILDLKVCDPAMGSGAFLVEACRYLGDALLESWRVYDELPAVPPDEDEVVFARRLVAQRCLYGVDRNPVAVDLAKMSLWLATLAKEHALTFIDHSLRHGDSLVGLSRKQIENFHWDTSITYDSPLRSKLREHVARVTSLRQQIREADETVPDEKRRELWAQAQNELASVRLFGDLTVAAFFDAEAPKVRERKRLEYVNAIVREKTEPFRARLEERRHTDPPLAPFHWEIEFPEVFDRAYPGFDAIIGNPPFLGGSKIRNSLGDAYGDWLLQMNIESHGNADLVAYFYRRAFELLRPEACFGLIATNTIAQGDTRTTGLRWICVNGGAIYAAVRRQKWPGQAAVIVSVVWVIKGHVPGPCKLDRHLRPFITAFLFHRGGHENPAILNANSGKSYQGSKPYGRGFVFDSGHPKSVSGTISEMKELIAKEPRNAERIFPYIGGEEVNDSPTHSAHRWIIDFGVIEEAEAWRWPDLMHILEQRVKPQRLLEKDKAIRQRWWIYQRPRSELYAAIKTLPRVLACCQVSKYQVFTWLPNKQVYDQRLIVFVASSDSFFGILQSRIHTEWADFHGSSMKDDPVYTSSDCFETFPFPDAYESNNALSRVGREYYEFRAALMVKNDEGLTKTYNRFHNPDERDLGILTLRELHSAMDRAVLDAYGWHDIPTECEFLLDYEIEEEDGGDKKKPYRYRWPDEVRDEVLARLLELNAERAAAEARAGTSPTAKRRKGGAVGGASGALKTREMFP